MKWSVLYIDDQEDNIYCMRELLMDKFDVIGTTNATHYGALLHSNRPHVILLDVHMPQMSGYELYSKIQEHSDYNGCPILFISGDVSFENRLKSHDVGATGFLSRDLGVEELIARITNKIKLHRSGASALKVSLGNLTVGLGNIHVLINSSPIDLTLLEMKMLGVMVRSTPETLSRQELIKKVWGDETVKPGTVDTHVSTLKTKLKDWDHVIKFRKGNVVIAERDQ